MNRYPKIPGYKHLVTRPGPTGDRAGMRDGMDVWEIVQTVRAYTASGSTIEEIAAEYGTPTVQIQEALLYYQRNTQEIEARIESNRQTFKRLRK